MYGFLLVSHVILDTALVFLDSGMSDVSEMIDPRLSAVPYFLVLVKPRLNGGFFPIEFFGIEKLCRLIISFSNVSSTM